MPFSTAFTVASGRKSIQSHKPRRISTIGFKKKRSTTSLWGVTARRDVQNKMKEDVDAGRRDIDTQHIEAIPARVGEAYRLRTVGLFDRADLPSGF